MSVKLTRREKAALRRDALAYARQFLGVSRLPRGAGLLVRDYVSRIDTLPWTMFDWPSDWRYLIFKGLARQLMPFQKRSIAERLWGLA